MSNWWSCPSCGRRLKWLPDTIACPSARCGYVTPRPAPIEPDRRPADRGF